MFFIIRRNFHVWYGSVRTKVSGYFYLISGNEENEAASRRLLIRIAYLEYVFTVYHRDDMGFVSFVWMDGRSLEYYTSPSAHTHSADPPLTVPKELYLKPIIEKKGKRKGPLRQWLDATSLSLFSLKLGRKKERKKESFE